VAPPAETEVLSWFDSLSNWGRWGADDELGTLNLITPEVRTGAAALVKDGTSVSCAWEVPTGPPGLERAITVVPKVANARFGYSTEQITAMTVHSGLTHLDALCHVFWDGLMYNGRAASLVSVRAGALALPITVARRGIVTRGVLLDVAASRGVSWLDPGEGVFPEDLEAAESRQGVRVGSGDAVMVRTGFGRYRRATGAPAGPLISQPGWHAAALPWMRDRDVAVIACDGGNDVVPPAYAAMPIPVHIIGLVAMGLWLIDNCDLEELAATAARLSRWEFHLAVCPLVLSGLTSSPVNPVATF